MAKKKKLTQVRTSTPRKLLPRINFIIDYKNYERLERYLSDRARIYGRRRTALSAKTQKKLARAIKHARHLGLLPFKPKI